MTDLDGIEYRYCFTVCFKIFEMTGKRGIILDNWVLKAHNMIKGDVYVKLL
jgi:hypothetical protein